MDERQTNLIPRRRNGIHPQIKAPTRQNAPSLRTPLRNSRQRHSTSCRTLLNIKSRARAARPRRDLRNLDDIHAMNGVANGIRDINGIGRAGARAAPYDIGANVSSAIAAKGCDEDIDTAGDQGGRRTGHAGNFYSGERCRRVGTSTTASCRDYPSGNDLVWTDEAFLRGFAGYRFCRELGLIVVAGAVYVHYSRDSARLRCESVSQTNIFKVVFVNPSC